MTGAWSPVIDFFKLFKHPLNGENMADNKPSQQANQSDDSNASRSESPEQTGAEPKENGDQPNSGGQQSNPRPGSGPGTLGGSSDLPS